MTIMKNTLIFYCITSCFVRQLTYLILGLQRCLMFSLNLKLGIFLNNKSVKSTPKKSMYVNM